MALGRQCQYTHISTTTTTPIAGAFVLNSITVNSVGTSATIIVYDGAVNAANIIASIAAPAVGTLTFDAQTINNAGLNVVTTGAPDVTIGWNGKN